MSTYFFSAPGRTEISGNHTDHQHGCVLAAAVNLETVAEVIVLDDPTITPIARRRGDAYEMDLVLRNNITTDEHPMGVYHPHAELHHIKKENIGLIEVMGLAVLPARLKTELQHWKKLSSQVAILLMMWYCPSMQFGWRN